MSYVRPSHSSKFRDGSDTDGTVAYGALATGLEAVEEKLDGSTEYGLGLLTPTDAAAARTLLAAAPTASPTFTGLITLPGGGVYGARTLNGDANSYLFMGNGEDIDNQVNDTYIATLTPSNAYDHVETTGATARGIGFNIGNWVVVATDGASAITRTAQWANIEHDFIQFEQTGGSAVFNNVVSSRFRFAIPKTGVTIVDNRGLDFVVPNAGDVTGSVTNYIAINIPALTGGGGTNFYGLLFRNAPNKGSIVSANLNDLTLNTLGDNYIRLRSQGNDVLTTGGTGVEVVVPVLSVNGAFASGTYTMRVSSGNGATDAAEFSLFKSGVTEWHFRMKPGVGENDLQFLAGSNVMASFAASTGKLTLVGGLDIGDTSFVLGGSTRPKTFKKDSSSSPDDVLQIRSEGASGGWNGAIDLQVSRSAGSLSTGLRVQALAGGTAVGFYGVTPVVKASAITSPTAPSAGYVQAEATSMKTAVDAIITALKNIGITA